ncbi:hypothetical protein [Rubritalea tangerina]|uniref:hypothetical protein n=1 Tax=Rubritalea tangerina TaxID=430798 RepID=UPI003622DAC3
MKNPGEVVPVAASPRRKLLPKSIPPKVFPTPSSPFTRTFLSGTNATITPSHSSHARCTEDPLCFHTFQAVAPNQGERHLSGKCNTHRLTDQSVSLWFPHFPPFPNKIPLSFAAQAYFSYCKRFSTALSLS